MANRNGGYHSRSDLENENRSARRDEGLPPVTKISREKEKETETNSHLEERVQIPTSIAKTREQIEEQPELYDYYPLLDTSNLCSSDICINNLEMYNGNRGDYHLLSNMLPTPTPSKDSENRCKLAILVSSMPYSGAEFIMTVVEEIVRELQLSFRGNFFWNFHAHSRMDNDNAKKWITASQSWLSSLDSHDFIVIRAPYKDDLAAKQVCQSTFTINSGRPLVDIVKMVISEKDKAFFMSPNEKKSIISVLRNILFHQKHFVEQADLNIDAGSFLNRDGLDHFILKICTVILDPFNQSECNSNLPEKVLENENVSRALTMQERELLKIPGNEEMIPLSNMVLDNFPSWIQRYYV
jgi:hypothetical protein